MKKNKGERGNKGSTTILTEKKSYDGTRMVTLTTVLGRT